MSAPLQTAVVGATGYAGLELVRLLARHPRLSPPLLLGREGESNGAGDLAQVFPHLSGNGAHPLEPFSWQKLEKAGVGLLLLATPYEVSHACVPEALQRGLRVVDLSGAWRLKQKQNRAVYGFTGEETNGAVAVLERAVYGLPELHRDDLRTAQLVANAGCYATSIILALAPLVRAGLVDPEQGIVCDSKSGVSGAGKQPTPRTHFVEVADNLSAYSVFGHRHTGEILEQLHIEGAQLTFTPHLLPIPRGILSTIYLRFAQSMSAEKVSACMQQFYQGSPWVRVFPQQKLPEIQFSLHTNYCDLGVSVAPDGKRAVLVSCLDNLLKGAAGQAVQNMNLMYGWDEREGLA
ncbi:MAG: N-acetyl-gamma-glutamyl-phosphate reductase [Terriglobales bacterium]